MFKKTENIKMFKSQRFLTVLTVFRPVLTFSVFKLTNLPSVFSLSIPSNIEPALHASMYNNNYICIDIHFGVLK